MRLRDPVLPEDLVEPGIARHEDEVDQDQVRPIQGSKFSGGYDGSGSRREIAQIPVTNPHPKDQESVAGQERVDVIRRDRPYAWNGYSACFAGGGRGHGLTRASHIRRWRAVHRVVPVLPAAARCCSPDGLAHEQFRPATNPAPLLLSQTES